MVKKMRKPLALFLALVMCLGMVNFTALANETADHEHNADGWTCTQAEPVKTLNCEEDHEHTDDCYTVTEGEWTCVAPVVEETPAEVTAFLSAVAAIPAITAENAAEVAEYVYGPVSEAYEALLGTGYEERADVQEAVAVYAAAIDAVDAALDMESSELAYSYMNTYDVTLFVGQTVHHVFRPPNTKGFLGNNYTGEVFYLENAYNTANCLSVGQVEYKSSVYTYDSNGNIDSYQTKVGVATLKGKTPGTCSAGYSYYYMDANGNTRIGYQGYNITVLPTTVTNNHELELEVGAFEDVELEYLVNNVALKNLTATSVSQDPGIAKVTTPSVTSTTLTNSIEGVSTGNTTVTYRGQGNYQIYSKLGTYNNIGITYVDNVNVTVKDAETTYTLIREYWIDGEKIAFVKDSTLKGQVGDEIVGAELAKANPNWANRKVDNVVHTFNYVGCDPTPSLTLTETVADNVITLKYEKNTKPQAPTKEEAAGILDGKYTVKVSCTNEARTHTLASKNYSITAADITSIGAVTKNASGKWEVEVTSTNQKFVDKFEAEANVNCAHDDVSGGFGIKLTWDGSKWTYNETTTKGINTACHPVQPTLYKLKYDANGGTIRSDGNAATTMTHEANSFDNSYTFTVKTAPEASTGFDPTWAGHGLLGWADTAAEANSGTVKYKAGDEITLTKEAPTKTIYAVWQVNTPATPDLTVTKTVTSGSTVKPGDNVTYKIIVTNNGNEAVENVVITDVLDSNLEFVGAVGSGTTKVWKTEPANGCYEIGTLAASSQQTGWFGYVEITVKVKDGATGTIKNTATADCDGLDTPESSNSADVTVKGPEYSLNVTKDNNGGLKVYDDPNVNADAYVNYTVTVKNTSDVDVYGLRLTDVMTVTPGASDNGLIYTFKDWKVDGKAITPASGNATDLTHILWLVDRNTKFAKDATVTLTYTVDIVNNSDADITVKLENEATGAIWDKMKAEAPNTPAKIRKLTAPMPLADDDDDDPITTGSGSSTTGGTAGGTETGGNIPAKKTVTYSWTGLPAGATVTKPADAKYKKGATVTVDTTYDSTSTTTVNGDIYTFSGWSRSGFFTIEENVTITGTWTPVITPPDPEYKVTVDPANGENKTETTVKENDEFTVPDAPTAPEGKEFDGWKGSDGKDYKPGDTITVTGNLTLTAQWKDKVIPEPEKITVTWKSGYGENETLKTGEYDKGTATVPAADYPAAPSRSGYTFTGWSDPVADADGNLTITAQWTENTRPVEPDPEPDYYTLTIRYVYADGTTARPTVTRRNLEQGDRYSVTSPVIEGYTADLPVVEGTMPARNETVTVTYTAEEDVNETEPPLVETPDVTETPEPVETQEPTETQPPEETENLGDNDTPLTENPGETEDLDEGDTPLAEVPQTGDSIGLWIVLTLCSAAGLYCFFPKKKKGQREA